MSSMKRHLVLPIRLVLVVVFTALLVGGGIAMERATAQAEQEHAKQQATVALRDGDIVLHYSGSVQCAAVAQATRSPYTHCGMVLLQAGHLWCGKRWVRYSGHPIRNGSTAAWMAMSW